MVDAKGRVKIRFNDSSFVSFLAAKASAHSLLLKLGRWWLSEGAVTCSYLFTVWFGKEVVS
jgi:hypothetical protein